MDILLASGSPRRRELLESAQIDFSVMSVDIDETPFAHESPKDYVQRMIATKAEAIITQLDADYKSDQFKHFKLSTPFIMLTADTIGVLADGKTVLVKPENRAHAYSMWQKMSDNTHQVWTAVQATVVSFSAEPSSAKLVNETLTTKKRFFQAIWQRQMIEQTDVSFIPLTQEIMRDYWDSGEPADKAGGYAIQGLAAAWVTRIHGSYTNVVGLPLAQTLALLNEAMSTYSIIK